MNIKGHFETITRHKLLVMKYCFECGLYQQGLTHDSLSLHYTINDKDEIYVSLK